MSGLREKELDEICVGLCCSVAKATLKTKEKQTENLLFSYTSEVMQFYQGYSNVIVAALFGKRMALNMNVENIPQLCTAK